MITNKPRPLEFLKSFRIKWQSSITGGVLAVLFTLLTLWVQQTDLRLVFAALIVLSAVSASYFVWESERKARIAAESYISELLTHPLQSLSVVVKNPNDRLAASLALRVVNIGKVHFAITGLELTISDKPPQIFAQNESVGIAETREIWLDSFWRGHEIDWEFGIDFQINLKVRWLEQENFLGPRGFHLKQDCTMLPRSVSEGYGALRILACPKCNHRLVGYLKTKGVMNEAEYEKRKAIYLEELQNSCPTHHSQFTASATDQI